MSKPYHYKACGLDSVYLHNIEVVQDDHAQRTHVMPRINSLHKVIARCLIDKHGALNPKELRFLRTEMGMTQEKLADFAKKDVQTVGRWERGETPIDPNAESMIRLLAAEQLGIQPEAPLAEMASWAVLSKEPYYIRIDGSNPEEYRPLKAA